MLKPGDENKEAKGGKDWTYWEQLRWKRGVFLGSQGGGGVEGAPGTMKASQLVCWWSPRTTSSAVCPAVWGCDHQSPDCCRVLPQVAACSSSWPWPCCSLPSRNTFAVQEDKNKRLHTILNSYTTAAAVISVAAVHGLPRRVLLFKVKGCVT